MRVRNRSNSRHPMRVTKWSMMLVIAASGAAITQVHTVKVKMTFIEGAKAFDATSPPKPAARYQ